MFGGVRWVVLLIGVPERVLFIRVPYYIWDLKRDASLENYSYYTIIKASFTGILLILAAE